MNDEIDANRHRFIFIEPHRTLKSHWEVNSLDPAFVRNLDDVVDSYSSVAHLQWSKLVAACEREGYEIIAMEDIAPILDWIRSLDRPTGAKLNSDYPGTDEDGLLPFQRQAVNFAMPLKACLMRHDTGVGKSQCAIAWTKLVLADHDCCIHVVKKNNLKGIQRKLGEFADIDAPVVAGSPKKRDELWMQIALDLERGNKPTFVINYEGIVNDREIIIEILTGRRVAIVWDELPSKLRNRNTKPYRRTCELLYTSYATSTYRGKTEKLAYPRAGYERFAAKHLILTATPIYNAPSDLHNILRLVDPENIDSNEEFERKYVSGIDPWGNPIWNDHKLPLFGAEVAFLTHSVDKTDPDIACHFPKPDPVTTPLKLLPKQQAIYDVLQQQYADMGDEELSALDRKDILGAINVLQMICSMPISVLKSAMEFEAWMDEGSDPDTRRGSEVAYKLRELIDDDEMFDTPSVKVLRLLDVLEERDGKLIIFTRMNETVIPHLSAVLEELDVGHVVYHGMLTDKRRQDAIDHFRGSDDCRVLVTSDAGQDSIDLPEADYVMHWDLPWTKVVKTQRENRANRLTSEFDSVRFETLLCTNTYEERNEEILDKKDGYDVAILKGRIAEVSRIARHDLLYALSGRDEYRH